MQGNINECKKNNLKQKQMKDTQNKRLSAWLLSGKKVNAVVSWNVLGIYRLASRIHDLKEKGIDIDSRFIDVQNSFGEKFRVKEYWVNLK